MELKAKIVGIIGGMGPLATIDLYSKIIKHTNAKNDQENLHVVIDSYAQIPDRTKYLKGEGENPLPYLLESANNLKKGFNIDVYCMPCNTAHYFINELRKNIDKPFISIVEAAFNEIKRYHFTKLGILATDGTLLGKVYHDFFEKNGVKIENFDENTQSLIMKAIYDVKANSINSGIEAFNKALSNIVKNKFDLLIAACTEIPILIPYKQEHIQIIDATDCLAKNVVKFCRE
ncbi:amino acid racemase [Desulfurella sp.]|uniref:aspartate/glutamate racemase family protein n=1 Tax=Desulfurella sp. TaxID=1962857 RepID=UPI0025C188AC|nr:amino acid racemase [Desulfurella sp.]